MSKVGLKSTTVNREMNLVPYKIIIMSSWSRVGLPFQEALPPNLVGDLSNMIKRIFS